MLAFIPTLNRQDSIFTHKLLIGSKFDWHVIVHDPLQLQQYLKRGDIPKERIHCSYAPRNISAQRNWIKDNLAPKGEYFAMMDDNISSFTAVKEEAYHEPDLEKLYPDYFKKNNPLFRKEFYGQEINQERLYSVFKELENECIRFGAGLGAFSANENYFFSRSKKWKYIQLICSKACIVLNDDLRYDENIKTIDDYDFSCQHMAKYGHVLVNAYVWPKSKHNQAGGIGKLNERAQHRINDCSYMMQKWPGLLKYKQRKNSIPMGEIQLRGFGFKFYNKWREEWMLKNSINSYISAS